jgi:hypothetical protein
MQVAKFTSQFPEIIRLKFEVWANIKSARYILELRGIQCSAEVT